MDELKAQLLADRLASFVRLKGGYSVPLAGAIYWAALGMAGLTLPLGQWILVAFVGSGAIFPLALLLSKILGNDFMKDETATGDVALPLLIQALVCLGRSWVPTDCTRSRRRVVNGFYLLKQKCDFLHLP